MPFTDGQASGYELPSFFYPRAARIRREGSASASLAQTSLLWVGASHVVSAERIKPNLTDPMSSLDQEYEERTAERLVALSATRQVIVFTHRLSLLRYLTQASDVHGASTSRPASRGSSCGGGR
jgi:hypothetical protein